MPPKSTAAKKTNPKRAAPAGAKPSPKRKVKKGEVLRLADFLPAEGRLDVLRRAAVRLDEVEQTQEVLKAVHRVADAYSRLGGQVTERLTGFEESAEERLGEAKGRILELAAVQRAKEVGEAVSGRALEELDELLDQVGLLRRAVHEQEIALLKKKHQAARRAAEKKAAKKAEPKARRPAERGPETGV